MLGRLKAWWANAAYQGARNGHMMYHQTPQDKHFNKCPKEPCCKHNGVGKGAE